MRPRLAPLDGSFLRVETPNAHMHVGWCAVFRPHPDRPRPSVEMLRRSVAGRLHLTPRFRQRLAFPPPGFGEPFWVDAPDFDAGSHITALTCDDDAVSFETFHMLTDAALSTPLDRGRPLWHVYLVPRLEDERVGMVAKLHHAMVDGLSAVELGLLLLDTERDAPLPPPPEPSERWLPSRVPGQISLAVESAASLAGDALRGARTAAAFAFSPRRQTAALAGTLRRVAAVVRDDLLPAAPDSAVNVPIGPQRTLVRGRVEMDALERARTALRASGGPRVTVNDVYLAAVAGALRTLALRRGERPVPLKAMVPVSVRSDSERASLGNRISFVFLELPVHKTYPAARLEDVHSATRAFKESGRIAGGVTVLSALGFLPDPLKDIAARMAASARVYNLTISNIPGPGVPVFMLGAELEEAHPVVPLSEDHALSVGVFTYRSGAFFGFYADPDALPEVSELPAAVAAEVAVLAGQRPAPRRLAVV
ncbi:MAG TPA: wax ester/triacylglycerol synthase family O-acyltransferase [Thermoleophilaceae bacterium]